MNAKRRKKHYTVDGIPWQRHDHTKCPGPDYIIHPDIHLAIKKHICSQLGDGDICTRRLKLPFYTVPMWPAKKLEGVLLYSYCVCSFCGRQLTGPAQIAVLLCLADLHGSLTLAWRIQLIGACCTHIDHQQLSYFAFILDAQTKLLPAIETAWSTFDDDNKASCRVCGRMLDCESPFAPLCKDPKCLDMWPFFEQYEAKREDTITVEHRMRNLIDHCFAEKIDLVLPLLNYVCHNPMCRKTLRDTEFMCVKCHAAVFCSSECQQQYHPTCSISYLDIFI